ncbi:MAG: NAD(P)H-dependent oxidoreductase subunit E [Dehalococcoidia bacterium]
MQQKILPGLQTILDSIRPHLSELLSALHKIQHTYGYVPREAIQPLASRLGATPALVYGAITFYSEIRLESPPQVDIAWCSGPACRLKGSENMRRALEAVLGVPIGQTSADRRLGLRLVQCDGTCDQAPLVRLNGRTVGNLTVSEAIRQARRLAEENRA